MFYDGSNLGNTKFMVYEFKCNFDSVTTSPVAIPRSNICFMGDTPIHTNQGDIPICEIKPGIHTIRNKKIVALTKTITDDKYLVCFEKDSLFTGVPSKKTLVSKNHKIFYKGSFLYAKCFLPMDNVSKMEYGGEFLYNIIMEEHDSMLVNDMICETLDPSNIITKVFTENSSAEEYNQQFQSSKNEFTEFCDKSDVL